MNDMKDELERRFAARMTEAGISAHEDVGDDSPKARRRVQRAKAAQFDDLVLSYNALLSRTGRTDRTMRMSSTARRSSEHGTKHREWNTT